MQHFCVFAECNMWFGWVMLFFCLSQTEPANVWDQQQTDVLYSVIPQQREESAAGYRVRTSSLGRTSRAVLGGGLTINTLPNNMTHVVEDSGKYYTWRRFGPEDRRIQDLWFDMTDVRHGQVRVHSILSNSYKQAVVSLTY
ncbi:plexin domain-containing protein 2-like [Poecilia formosa]|uniref:plexin domain-containing protein 2-like n=1 Tax=Poecilia formosa TaxID=48698 RepID=UPI0004446CB0|nr:PREDICTED: plexin domain-containing protein 2-like [Poecilia formosa]